MAAFEELLPGIFLLKSPFCDSWSGIYLIKRRVNLLIDSGANASVVDSCLLPALGRLGLSVSDLDLLLCTHTHGDHIGGHFRLKELCPGLRVAAFRGSADKLRNPLKYSKLIRAAFPSDSPPPPAVLNGVEPDELFDDAAGIDTGRGLLRLVHTPGHDTDCVCFHDEAEGALLSGDSLQANGTDLQGVGFYQDLPAYRNSLRALSALGVRSIVCGHAYNPIGAFIQGDSASSRALSECLRLTELYEGYIRARWNEGVRDLRAIAGGLVAEFGGRTPEKLFLPLYTVVEHLKEIDPKWETASNC